MFRNKSAWFSSSVPQACHDFWVLEGGTVVSWRTADYLFSEDATCPDTLRIFGSKDYLWNKVVVFHSLFLSVCEKRQSVKSVCIGHYVLPPTAVQEEVRNVVGRLIFEHEDEQSVAPGSHYSLSYQTEDEYSEGEISRRYVSMDKLQKYSGDLSDFHSTCVRCSKCKAHYCLPPT
ncbi:telomere repeats-binding bouquet formation protein 2 [Symphorus nematophorus]